MKVIKFKSKRERSFFESGEEFLKEKKMFFIWLFVSFCYILLIIVIDVVSYCLLGVSW